ncbi:MAG: hypothetical protein QF596_07180 [Acidimicrobiales bacterium]|jgi:hypothetical protein|nr:hypothetical protein [Acidimicrobiales bacterium]MDP6298730.1 hypothetical protein [Acidimicrobiales bacterium]
MNRFRLSFLAITFLLSSLACGGGGGGNDETGNVAVGGQGGQVVVNTDAVEAAETQRDNDEEPEALSVEDVEVEELNTESEEEAEEDGIEVATAEEDPLDGLLNAVSKFQGCLEDEGFEFIGAPGQPGPDGETVDPSEFEDGYLQALQKCATESNILESFTAFSEAQANLTPEEIAQLNFGIPVFGECLERLGWEVGEIVPDERGALGFGANGSGLTPPEDSDGIFPTDDINSCRQESTTYVQENYVTDED